MLEGPVGRAFLDLVFIMLFAFMASDVMMLPWLNPEGEEQSEQVEAQGDLIFEVEWPPGIPVDVDLWVRAPGYVAVGYSNQNVGGCNLLRDDLGLTGDPLEGNYEQTQCRGLPSGEWVVNVHYYRGTPRDRGVPVKWVVRALDGAVMQTILKGDDWLEAQEQELTMVRFHLGVDGKLIAGSQHNGLLAIRTASR